MKCLGFSRIVMLFVLLDSDASTMVAQQNDSFSFLLSGVEKRTVSFEGGEGCAWKNLSYECAVCSFLVYQTGVTGEAKEATPGLLVNLRDGGKLGVTCQASECSVTSILSSGKTESQKLMAGQTGVVATSAHVSITVKK